MEKKLIEMGKKYKTKDGRNVKILQFINNEDYPVVAVVTEEDGTDDVKGYTKYGAFYKNTPCNADLIEQPEVVTKNICVTLYNNGDTCMWSSEELARKHLANNVVALKVIPVEFTAGEGL